MIAEVTIDLDAIVENARALAALVAPARFAAVVKANAYGHGLVPVARALEPHVARFCVYALEEAVVLRDAGIAAPIHVLGPVTARDLETAHESDVELTLWDRGLFAREAARVARRRNRPLPVHAKIDTGVARLGIPCSEAPEALERYASTPELALVGAFSHLAAAEELDSPYTHEQLARFLRATAAQNGRLQRHIAATAAAMLWPETRLDAVRCGIGLYGIWPSDETKRRLNGEGLGLEPALAWRTRLVAVHDVAPGETVGYGRTWTAERPSRIATLPIGYAEGLPRNAGNSAQALVRGRRVPLVGRVCMNMAFVDVTDVPGATLGDAVTLVGRDGDERITAEQLAAACGTIGYEIVARLPAHVPRTFVQTRTAGCQGDSTARASVRSSVPS